MISQEFSYLSPPNRGRRGKSNRSNDCRSREHWVLVIIARQIRPISSPQILKAKKAMNPLAHLRDQLSRYHGLLEFTFRPGLATRRNGPFNGQSARQSCYHELMEMFGFNAIIETGSYRGITTSLFAEAGVPVYSIEAMTRFATYSARRFRDTPHVKILKGDSRQRLQELAEMTIADNDNVFFYLDAHWYDDLPLREEIEIVRKHWTNWVIMIDDFEVPGTSYSYDAYGPGRNLDAEYLQPFVDDGITVFYPAAPSSAETGAKRGSVVLCEDPQIEDQLNRCMHLRRSDANDSVVASQVA